MPYKSYQNSIWLTDTWMFQEASGFSDGSPFKKYYYPRQLLIGLCNSGQHLISNDWKYMGISQIMLGIVKGCPLCFTFLTWRWSPWRKYGPEMWCTLSLLLATSTMIWCLCICFFSLWKTLLIHVKLFSAHTFPYIEISKKQIMLKKREDTELYRNQTKCTVNHFITMGLESAEFSLACVLFCSYYQCLE